MPTPSQHMIAYSIAHGKEGLGRLDSFSWERQKSHLILRSSVMHMGVLNSVCCLGVRSPNHVTTGKCFDWHCMSFISATKTVSLAETYMKRAVSM